MLRVLEAIEKRFESFENAISCRLDDIKGAAEEICAEVLRRPDHFAAIAQLQSAVDRLSSQSHADADANAAATARLSRTARRTSARLSRSLVEQSVARSAACSLRHTLHAWQRVRCTRLSGSQPQCAGPTVVKRPDSQTTRPPRSATGEAAPNRGPDRYAASENPARQAKSDGGSLSAGSAGAVGNEPLVLPAGGSHKADESTLFPEQVRAPAGPRPAPRQISTQVVQVQPSVFSRLFVSAYSRSC